MNKVTQSNSQDLGNITGSQLLHSGMLVNDCLVHAIAATPLTLQHD
jgi:hypothetical protein